MKVEILTPPDDSFVVGRDLVGFANVGDSPDVWEDLIDDAGSFTAQRGGTSPALNALDVGTLSVPLRDADPETDDRLRVGRRVRLHDEDRETDLWFGRVADIPATDERDYLVTTLAASDPVDELTNARMSGVGTPGQTENLKARVERLGVASTVPLRYVWAGGVPVPAAASGWTARDDQGASIPVTAVPGGFKTSNAASWTPSHSVGTWLELRIPTPDWIVDHRYEITATVKVELVRDGYPTITDRTYTVVSLDDASGTSDDDSYFVETSSPVSSPSPVTFTTPALPLRPNRFLDVTAVVATPAGTGAGTYTLTVTDVTAKPLEGYSILQAVGTEASVTEHLNMACDSVGAVWRPTLDGAVEVIEGNYAADVVARFTDDPFDPNMEASFTALEMGYAATDDLINDLSVTNRGPTADSTKVYTNATSIAAHGRRSATLDTCLATQELVDSRAAVVLAEASTPRWAPRAVTYLYDDLEVVPELYSAVQVTRREKDHVCLVLGARHEVHPDSNQPTGRKHLVTLTLRKVS